MEAKPEEVNIEKFETVTDRPEKPDHYSHSSLREFDECPARWHRKRVKGEDEPVSDPLIFGSVAHELTAEYDKHCLNHHVGTNKSQEDHIFRAALDHHPEAKHLRAELAALFSEYVERTIVPDTLVAIEERMSTNIIMPDGREIPFVVVVDRLYSDGDGNYTVIDHKTDGAIRSQADVEKDKQLARYAMLVMDVYKADSVQTGLLFLRYGVERVASQDHTPESIELVRAEVVQSIMEIEKAFETGEFPYRVGHSCATCGFASTCPKIRELSDADPSFRGEHVIVDGKDAELAAQTLIAIDARKKAVRDMLKVWCSENGNIVTGGKEVGYSKRESVDYPVEYVIPILGQFDLPCPDYLKANTTALKKAAKADAELEAALAEIREDKSTTAFTMVKAKE